MTSSCSLISLFVASSAFTRLPGLVRVTSPLRPINYSRDTHQGLPEYPNTVHFTKRNVRFKLLQLLNHYNVWSELNSYRNLTNGYGWMDRRTVGQTDRHI